MNESIKTALNNLRLDAEVWLRRFKQARSDGLPQTEAAVMASRYCDYLDAGKRIRESIQNPDPIAEELMNSIMRLCRDKLDMLKINSGLITRILAERLPSDQGFSCIKTAFGDVYNPNMVVVFESQLQSRPSMRRYLDVDPCQEVYKDLVTFTVRVHGRDGFDLKDGDDFTFTETVDLSIETDIGKRIIEVDEHEQQG